MSPIITDLIFYIFSAGLLVSAVLVVTLTNPMYALLCLIMTFFQSAGLFLVFQAEFLAMLMLIVYVGAVAVLFLFVVMLLNVDKDKASLTPYQKTALWLGLVMLVEMVFVGYLWKANDTSQYQANIVDITNKVNIDSIGLQLYTQYVFAFQVCGVILLVAMIGAIVLALSKKKDHLSQNITVQNKRQPKDTLRMTNPKIGEGVKV